MSYTNQTDEIIEQARHANLCEYFKSNGYEVEQSRNELHVKGDGGLYINEDTNEPTVPNPKQRELDIPEQSKSKEFVNLRLTRRMADNIVKTLHTIYTLSRPKGNAVIIQMEAVLH